jgi:hypothetical protein
MHVCIENLFGLLTNGWQTLQSPMKVSLFHPSGIIMATSRLQNYVMTLNSSMNTNSDSILVASRYLLNWEDCSTAERLSLNIRTSQVHDIVLRQVAQYGMRHPALIIKWHRAELHEIGLM